MFSSRSRFTMRFSAGICVLEILCSLAGYTLCAHPMKLPKDFPTCKRSDPSFDDCVKSAFQASLPHLSRGISKFGLFPLEPLYVPKVSIQGGQGSISLGVTFSDLHIIGLSKAKVESLRSNLEAYELDSTISDALVRLEGNYEISGQILLLPLNERGKCTLLLSEPSFKNSLRGKPKLRDGELYMEVESLAVDLSVSRVTYNLTTSDVAVDRLGLDLNNFMNENWESIFEELKPSVDETIGHIFKEVANKVFMNVPFDNIFIK